MTAFQPDQLQANESGPRALPPCVHRGRVTAERCVCRSPHLIGRTVALRVCTGEAFGLPACKYAETEAAPHEASARPVPRRSRPLAETRTATCQHLLPQLRVEVCRTCGGKGSPAAVFGCARHGECTLKSFGVTRAGGGTIRSCRSCPDYAPAEQPVRTWAVGITTAPRETPTLARTLSSVRRAGWQPVIYAEPESHLEGIDAPIVRRDPKLGAWRNWVRTAEQLLAAETSHVLILQDDVELCFSARLAVDTADWPADVGCHSLYTSAKYDRRRGGRHSLPTRDFWGALALAFPADVLRRLLEHRVVQQWNRSANIDTAIGRALGAMGLKIYGWSPSLAQHIGDTSTLWPHKTATGNRVARECRMTPREAPPVVAPPLAAVSIVITARNYARFLPEAIESALGQTLPCQVIYSDDFSTDGSVDVARRYEERGLIVLSAGSHRGVAQARNRGVAASTGEYLIHLDGDDTLPATFAADHFAAMAPGVPFVYGPALATGEGPRAGTLWKVPEWSAADLWRGNSVNTSAMFARSAFLAAGGWRDGIGTMWDWDLALRASRLGTPRASTATLNYRQHADSWSHQFREFNDNIRPGHQNAMRRMNATLSIGTICSGRLPGLFGEWLRRLVEAVDAMELPAKPDLTILDNSRSADFAAMVRRETDAAGDRFSAVRIVPHPERFAWSTEQERRDKVAAFMAGACNRLQSLMLGDTCWIVEDDILLPAEAGTVLRNQLTSTIAARHYLVPYGVTGAYRTRHGAGYYVAGWLRDGKWPHVETLPAEPMAVDYSGTGCLMFWRTRPATPRVWKSHYERAAAHDWAWGLELKRNKGLLQFLPVVCGHAQSETEVLW